MPLIFLEEDDRKFPASIIAILQPSMPRIK
jgi:hypothetical protein